MSKLSDGLPEILPPSEDGVFHSLLTRPDSDSVLCDLLSSILGIPVKKATVRNARRPIMAIDEKREQLDINCLLDSGKQVDVEMQTTPMTGDNRENAHITMRKRMIFNLCGLHASQEGRGIAYNKMLQSYQVTLANFSIFDGMETFFHRFSFRDETGSELSDMVQIIVIELTKLKKLFNKSVEDMTPLEQWALFFKSADDPERRSTLEQLTKKREAIRMATDILTSISKSEIERAHYRSRMIYQRDRASELSAVRREEQEKLQGVMAQKDAALAAERAALAAERAEKEAMRADLSEIRAEMARLRASIDENK